MIENKNVIEVKFNSEKEKIFIFLKSGITTEIYDQILELLTIQEESNIYLLPSEFIESVKVIKDIKK